MRKILIKKSQVVVGGCNKYIIISTGDRVTVTIINIQTESASNWSPAKSQGHFSVVVVILGVVAVNMNI